MQNYVTLTCPSCGGKLQITEDIDRFTCAYCGNEYFVKRGGEPLPKPQAVVETPA